MPDVVRLGHYEDATSALSQWHVPATHYLETWSDALTPSGSYVAMQPMILPALRRALGTRRAFARRRAAESWTDRNWCRRRFARLRRRAISRRPGASFCTTVSPPICRLRIARRNSTAIPRAASRTRFGPTKSPPPTKDSPEIVLVGSYAMDDGRYINNGWLQEMPDPITKLTWDNAAMMSPAFAHQIGVEGWRPGAGGNYRDFERPAWQTDPARVGHRRAHRPGTCRKFDHDPVGLRTQTHRPGR